MFATLYCKAQFLLNEVPQCYTSTRNDLVFSSIILGITGLKPRVREEECLKDDRGPKIRIHDMFSHLQVIGQRVPNQYTVLQKL